MSSMAIGIRENPKLALRRLALVGVTAVATLNVLTLALVLTGVSSLQAVATNLFGLSSGDNRLIAIATIMAVLLAGLGGGAWGWLLGRLTGYVDRRRLAWATGVAYGLALPIVLISLGQFESYLTKGGAIRPEIIPHIHWFFLGSWGLGMVVLLGAPALAVGLAVGYTRHAIGHAIYTGVMAGLGFVVVDAVMYASGWRVGDPDFPERPTMSVVVLLGFAAATLVSGLLQAVWLWQRKVDK